MPPEDAELLMVGMVLLLTDAGHRSKDTDFKEAALSIATRLDTRLKERKKS